MRKFDELIKMNMKIYEAATPVVGGGAPSPQKIKPQPPQAGVANPQQTQQTTQQQPIQQQQTQPNQPTQMTPEQIQQAIKFITSNPQINKQFSTYMQQQQANVQQ